MKKSLFLLLMCVIACFSFIQGDLVTTKISSRVTMDVHKNLNLIPISAATRQGETTAPMAVYESTNQEARLVARLIKEYSDTTVKAKFKNRDARKANSEKDLDLERLFRKGALFSQFDKVELIQDEVKNIKGRDFIVFEYVGTLKGVNSLGEETTSKTYIYHQLTFIKERNYIFNFNCPEAEKSIWQDHVNDMMNSVKIKK